jgi:hypothetical protein
MHIEMFGVCSMEAITTKQPRKTNMNEPSGAQNIKQQNTKGQAPEDPKHIIY